MVDAAHSSRARQTRQLQTYRRLSTGRPVSPPTMSKGLAKFRGAAKAAMGVSRFMRGVTTVTQPHLGGTSMQTGPSRKCCRPKKSPTPPDAPAACLVGLPKPSLRRSGSRCNGKKTTSAGLAGFGLEEGNDVGVYQSRG